jgi:hypothetical protein
VHTLFTDQRERERKRGREGDRESEKGGRENLFLKRMMGALVPFSYLVFKKTLVPDCDKRNSLLEDSINHMVQAKQR